MEYYAEMVLDIKATLGECPVWSANENVLYFVDILKPSIYKFDPLSMTVREYIMPEDIGCIGLREKGGFIAAMRTGVYLLNEDGHIIQKVADNPTDPVYSRFNDGRVDPWGHFWCGTIWEKAGKANAKILRIEYHTMSYKIVSENLTISNGIAFSPDHKNMYYTNTPQSSLFSIYLDEITGAPVSQSQMIYHFGNGQPDGAAFDSDGNYWSAQFGDGKILCISPKGKILHRVILPVKQVTMAAFGGNNLDTIFITTSRENMTEEMLEKFPLSGSLFAVKTSSRGVVEPFFKG